MITKEAIGDCPIYNLLGAEATPQECLSENIREGLKDPDCHGRLSDCRNLSKYFDNKLFDVPKH